METPDAPGSPDAATPWSEVPWSSLGLSAPVLLGIAETGYLKPTPVQAAAIPAALRGVDILCRSKTGTGKTAAFVLPMIERMTAGTGGTQGLVLCPTRELALQVADEAGRLGRAKGIRVVAIYGGVGFGLQNDGLESGFELVVGTPGRVFDHLRRGTFDARTVRHVCLDEADEMLSMGFYEEVTAILDRLPRDRQILLFSATVEDAVRGLVQRYLRDPEDLFLSTDVRTVDGITHYLYETTTEYPKPRQILHILDIEDPHNGIIFCNTREDTGVVARFLSRQGIDAEPLSSDLTQKARERVMGRIKRGDLRFLVATDIAARGIDISDLTHVINYSLPEDPSVYVHRVGRTGRIGRTGTAISLWSGRELHTRKILKQTFNIQFIDKPLPSREEARRLFTERHMEELRQAAGQVAYEGYLPIVEEIRKRPDADALLAVALRGFFLWHRQELLRRGTGEAGEAEVAEPGGGGGSGEGGSRADGGGRGRGGRDRHRSQGRDRPAPRRDGDRPRVSPPPSSPSPPPMAPPPLAADATPVPVAVGGAGPDRGEVATPDAGPGAGAEGSADANRRRRRRRRGRAAPGREGVGGGAPPESSSG